MIEVSHLRKVFPNGDDALKDISFDGEPGQFIYIIGRSGAGESTLLRCLNGMAPATSGKILTDGVEVAIENGTRIVESPDELYDGLREPAEAQGLTPEDL